MKTNKGFTLIELLVVIAIIGILSSVVLASLNTARSKGSDTAIKSQLNSIKAEAALFYDSGSTYVGLFNSGTQAKKLYDAAVAQEGTGTSVATSSTAVWAAAVPLKSATGYFCVDSTGNSTTTSGASATISASDADCN